ncbi:HET-domain-containing protein [Pleurotus eryngii]|uniref:HET-domain-containing protein n=1 Tax=Pleurotus eryngii TaxID=5323 RepID=A0A9P5ZRR6_PLEER|nr:HET-domain-containing protein [Pleurotus eryngii]
MHKVRTTSLKDLLGIRSHISITSKSNPSNGSSIHHSPNTALCSTCSAIDFHAMLGEGVTKENAVPLGPLLDIVQKARAPTPCAFCGLVETAFQRSWALDSLPADLHEELHSVTCSLYSEVRGCFTSPLPPLKEHCHRLSVLPSKRPPRISQLSMAARTRLVQDIQLMEDDARLFNRKTDAHGRKVGDVVDIRLLKTWMKRCKDGHKDVCEKVWWRNWKERLPKTVRMVDVQKMCIIPVPDDCRYVALSYVWGGVGSSYQTVQENLPRRKRTGGLDISILPATIVDSIELCKRLGERYLWIDALCIVQDSPDDKAVQIGVMEMIYGGAFVTFFAVGGRDAHAGLPGFLPGTREKHQTIEMVKDLHLAVPLPDLKEVLTKSIWGTRGWTYQEVMLSRRRIFFTEQQVYFQCLEDIWAEDVFAEHRGESHAYHPLRFTGVMSFMFRDAPSHEMAKLFTSGYQSVVDEYTPRNLTNELDAIDAVSALITTISKAYRLDKTAFRYGMLLRDLDNAMLWSPVDSAALVRRAIPAGSPWPSWSWVGWRGGVVYLDKWSFGGSHPGVSESLVDTWYLVEGGVAKSVDVRRTGPSGFPTQNMRYSHPKGRVDVQNIPRLPEGTLIFRTTVATFEVGELDALKSARTAEVQNGLFALMSGGPRVAAAGRIFIPLKTKAGSQPAFTKVELVVLSRCGGETGIYDENVYGKMYSSSFLYVMAVKPTESGDARKLGVVERIGLGIIFEQAWLEASTVEKVVYLA